MQGSKLQELSTNHSPIRSGSTSESSSTQSISEGSTSDDDGKCSLPSPPPTKVPTKVLDADRPTPDSWLPRDPRLIRLTGSHPFNVEAPLTDLFGQGFLTSPELFYVRNHGPVPQVNDDECLDWEVTIEGMVENPFKITLRQLQSEYDNVTYPITLVCAGNRRKEQNIVRKSKGFSWGPAGVSTALFTGVAMGDIIKKANPRRGAKFVCMEGADKLPNGHYGTSIRLSWAMDPSRGIMLAYGMNGETLRPDHGKPLRVAIPGQIGGRSVKWLKKLIITDTPSENWYHIYDNRVLPTMVSPEDAANDKRWWSDERYAIYDLSPNSAIACPAHDEQMELIETSFNYQCKGYAYSGAGRRVTRVEVSIDQGKTWMLASINYPEDLYREAEEESMFGGRLDVSWRDTCFCWCFWSCDIPCTKLESAKDIVVRAMDESMCIQPRDLYWNVLGMMNNPWYRIAIHREGNYLRFEHPTQPALIPGGWMERVKKEGGNIANGFWGEQVGIDDSNDQPLDVEIDIPMVKPGLNKTINITELKHHTTKEEPWFVVNGEVYDGTRFLEEHPGGAQSIVSAAATDATEEFLAIHSETAKAMMPSYHIGTLDSASKASLESEEAGAVSDDLRTEFLDAKRWTKAKLSSKRSISWNTRIFSFALEHSEQTLGMPVGQHLSIRLRDPATREAIIRAYTPISEVNHKGIVDILVKVYFADKGNPGGKMSLLLDSLPIGHEVDFKGPIGRFEYLGKGHYSINGRPFWAKRFLMICGGSGVTPILQVFRTIMQDAEDKTSCTVINGNRLMEDILCKEELDQLVEVGLGKGTICYTLSKAEETWCGEKGRIDKNLAEREGGLYEPETLALVCGPETMEASIKTMLRELNWPDERVHFF